MRKAWVFLEVWKEQILFSLLFFVLVASNKSYQLDSKVRTEPDYPTIVYREREDKGLT